MESPPLFKLPVELVKAITDLFDPPSIVDFALTCKHVFSYCQEVLEQRQAFNQKYRSLRRRGPDAIPRLVELALRHPRREIWHLQELDFDATEIDLNRQAAETPPYRFPLSDGTQDLLAQGWKISEEELASLFITHLCLPRPYAEEWVSYIQDGTFEPFIVLLLALAPRLTTVSFPIDTAFEELDEMSLTVALFLESISRISESPEPIWPPGFQSIQKLTLSDFPDDDRDTYDDLRLPSEVSWFYVLPNLKTLSLGRLQDGLERGHPYTELNSSTVENLSFTVLGNDAAIQYLALCPRHLRRLNFGGYFEELISEIDNMPVLDALEELGPIYMTVEQDMNLIGHLRLLDLTDFSCLTCIEKLPFISLLDKADGDEAHFHRLRPLRGIVNWGLRRLVDVLPESLERVRIEEDDAASWAWCLSVEGNDLSFALLDNIADLARHIGFTNLKEVCILSLTIENGFQWNESVYAEILSHGVTLHRLPDGARATHNDIIADAELHARRAFQY